MNKSIKYLALGLTTKFVAQLVATAANAAVFSYVSRKVNDKLDKKSDKNEG